MMEWLTEAHFLRPLWLWALLPGVALAALLWHQRHNSGGWQQVIDPELLPHLLEDQGRRPSGRWLWLALLAWVLASIAAAGPSFRQLPQPVEQPTDALVLLLDLSYSMKSTDLAPSRIDRSRQKLVDLLQRRSAGQTALVVFAGDAHVVTPLTNDYRTIANLLPALNPDMMPVPGSDSPAAVEQALSLLRSAGIPRGHLLLISDGVETDQVKRIGETMAGTGSRLSVMAVGTAEGAPLPLPRGGFLRDRDGAIVIPGLDSGPLRQLASANGGRFSRLQSDDSDLNQLLASAPLPERQDGRETSRTADTWEDQGYWLVLLLLPLAAMLFRRGWLLTLFPLLLLPSPPVDAAESGGWRDWWWRPDQQGQQALEEGDPARAATLFEDPDWRGTAAYRAGDFQAAAEAFTGNDSADAWYNRGNALARAGELEAAAKAYRTSLERDPERNDARENLDLVEKLRKKQDQQGENNKGDEPEDQDEQSRQDGSGDGGGGDSQSGEESGEAQSGEQAGDSPGDQPGQPVTDQAGDEGNGSGSEDGEGSNPWTAAEPGDPPDSDEEGPPLPRFTPEEAERRQALEQWLRRVPDDPSGLLREKFRHESRQRQPSGERKDDAPYW